MSLQIVRQQPCMHKPLYSWQADRHISQPRERVSDRLPHQRHDENQDNQVIFSTFTHTDLFKYLKVFSFVFKYALSGSFNRKHTAKTLANRSWHLITAPPLKTPFNQVLTPCHTVPACLSTPKVSLKSTTMSNYSTLFTNLPCLQIRPRN